MKKFVGALCALLPLVTLLIFAEMPTEATSAIQDSFTARYGTVLASRYSCDLCHLPGNFQGYNPYGADLLDALAETGTCLEFFPPNTHTIAFGRCEYLHAEGLFTPFTNKCTHCHGATLEGLIAPSCFLCHGKRWTEDGPAIGDAPDMKRGGNNINDAFTTIEPLDSDGDGFSNIAEINADTHPGDATSIPGTAPEITVTMETNWKRDWYKNNSDLKITVTPKGSTELDEDVPIFIQTDGGKLYSTKVTVKGSSIELLFPKALMYTIIKDLDAAGTTVTVFAKTIFDETVTKEVDVNFTRMTPDFVAGLKIRFAPNVWEKGKDVTVTITDRKGLVNETKTLTARGPADFFDLKDVARKGNRVTGTISASDALKMLGDGMEKTQYPISITGKSTDRKMVVAVYRAVTAIFDGGGDDCFDFDAPASHNIPFLQGVCSYLHAPGYDTPFDNNCNACHGPDLRGIDNFAPSCFLCHDQIWNTVPPLPSTKSTGGANR